MKKELTEKLKQDQREVREIKGDLWSYARAWIPPELWIHVEDKLVYYVRKREKAARITP